MDQPVTAGFASRVARDLPPAPTPKPDLTGEQLAWLREHVRSFADLQDAVARSRRDA